MAAGNMDFLRAICGEETIACDYYDLHSKVENDSNKEDTSEVVKSWADIICAKAKEPQFLSNSVMEEQIKEALKKRSFAERELVEKLTSKMASMG